MKELDKAFKEAWSYESRADDLEVEEIGVRDTGDRRYILLRDAAGHYWYQMMIRVNGTYLSEEEAIFGKKLRSGRRRK